LFRRDELVELSKLITLASVKLQNHEVADCLRLLEGYWPRFLAMHVPIDAPVGLVAENTKTPASAASGGGAPAAGGDQPVGTTAAGTAPTPGTAATQPSQGGSDAATGQQQADSATEKPAERTGFMDRMKQYVPRWMRF
jgi:hypothetical protein